MQAMPVDTGRYSPTAMALLQGNDHFDASVPPRAPSAMQPAAAPRGAQPHAAPAPASTIHPDMQFRRPSRDERDEVERMYNAMMPTPGLSPNNSGIAGAHPAQGAAAPQPHPGQPLRAQSQAAAGSDADARAATAAPGGTGGGGGGSGRGSVAHSPRQQPGTPPAPQQQQMRQADAAAAAAAAGASWGASPPPAHASAPPANMLDMDACAPLDSGLPHDPRVVPDDVRGLSYSSWASLHDANNELRDIDMDEGLPEWGITLSALAGGEGLTRHRHTSSLDAPGGGGAPLAGSFDAGGVADAALRASSVATRSAANDEATLAPRAPSVAAERSGTPGAWSGLQEARGVQSEPQAVAASADAAADINALPPGLHSTDPDMYHMVNTWACEPAGCVASQTSALPCASGWLCAQLCQRTL